MTMLKDCSEVREARDLLLKIMSEPAPARRQEAPGVPAARRTRETTEPLPRLDDLPQQSASGLGTLSAVDQPAAPSALPESEQSAPLAALVTATLAQTSPFEAVAPEPPPVNVPSGPAEETPLPEMQIDAAEASGQDPSSRGDRLRQILTNLCAHDGFSAAMVTDSSGLALAVSSGPVASDNLAACATVLGDALVKAGSYLGQDDAGSVSLDVNDREKAVVHRFPCEGRPYYLLALCLQHVEARRELDRAVPEIVAALNAR